MYYDHELETKFRKFAVADSADLVSGKTYYSNTYPYEFVFTRVDSLNNIYGRDNSHALDNEVSWFVCRNDENKHGKSHFSLHDRGVDVTHPYNPWMIFETKEDRDRCLEELEITFENKYNPFDYDGDYYGCW